MAFLESQTFFQVSFFIDLMNMLIKVERVGMKTTVGVSESVKAEKKSNLIFVPGHAGVSRNGHADRLVSNPTVRIG